MQRGRIRDEERNRRGSDMGFLIKCAFWLGLVLLVLPLGGKDAETGEPQVGALQAFAAARVVIDDLSGLCERHPDVCVVGEAVAETIGVRAREGARMAYEMLDQHFDDAAEPAPQEAVQPLAAEDAVGGDDVLTGSIVRQDGQAGSVAVQPAPVPVPAPAAPHR